MHYYQFNIGEYASHTRHLSPIEDIAYRRLLDQAYTTELPLPKDIRQLSRLVNLREYQQEITDVLNEFFFEVDDGWVHNRVIKEIEKTGKKSESAKNSAAKRWDKKRKEESMQSHTDDDANASDNNANASENDATHYPLPITNNQIPKERETPQTSFELPEWVNQEHWNIWHSKGKRKTASLGQKVLALGKLIRWRDAGLDYAKALEDAAEGGWQGLHEPKATVSYIKPMKGHGVISDADFKQWLEPTQELIAK